MVPRAAYFLLTITVSVAAGDLDQARDSQDRGKLEQIANQSRAAAEKQSQSAEALYRLALVQSYLAEVAIEVGDKSQARTAAETGIKAAGKAVELKPDSAEYHRLLGTLCTGQVIPANVLAGLKWGRCAQDEVAKAVQLDPKAAINYVSRGVGNLLPAAVPLWAVGSNSPSRISRRRLSWTPSRLTLMFGWGSRCARPTGMRMRTRRWRRQSRWIRGGLGPSSSWLRRLRRREKDTLRLNEKKRPRRISAMHAEARATYL